MAVRERWDGTTLPWGCPGGGLYGGSAGGRVQGREAGQGARAGGGQQCSSDACSWATDCKGSGAGSAVGSRAGKQGNGGCSLRSSREGVTAQRQRGGDAALRGCCGRRTGGRCAAVADGLLLGSLQRRRWGVLAP